MLVCKDQIDVKLMLFWNKVPLVVSFCTECEIERVYRNSNGNYKWPQHTILSYFCKTVTEDFEISKIWNYNYFVTILLCKSNCKDSDWKTDKRNGLFKRKILSFLTCKYAS